MSKRGMTAGAPPCTSCGAPRWFEFQIVPNLLTEIEKASDFVETVLPIMDGHDIAAEAMDVAASLGDGPDSLDWGIIAVYTCSKSCEARMESAGCAYVEEFCWSQSI